MAIELTITNVFQLQDGMTVIAFNGSGNVVTLAGKQACLLVDGKARQNFSIIGERLMLNKASHENERALETQEHISITLEEAQSKRLRLRIID